jgi:cyclopropane-fatty-acyl-phospholipid synthase
VAHAPTASGAYRTDRNVNGLPLTWEAMRRRVTPSTGARIWDRWLLSAIYGRLHNAPVRLRLWDGTAVGTPEADAVGTIVIHDRPTLISLATNPDLAFGDGYAAGRIDLEGDLLSLLQALYRARPQPVGGRDGAEPTGVPRALARSRDNIHHHYDIGNAFYELWLDRDLVYTCAYFPTPEATLEEAQIAKMEHVCRKLQLRPGDRVIEAGCGWGALARYMASRYGVRVRAFNISHEQIAYARRRAHEEGLGDRVEFVEDDYRNIDDRCDVFVSVGMLEHVGRSHYPDFAAVIDRTLVTDGGRGLLHFIGRNRPQPLHPWVERRIFPGAYPPTLAEVAEGVLAPAGLSMLDVENLRLHYARTLEHWLTRFEGTVDQVVSMFDEAFARAWRLYLAGSIAGFVNGYLQLFQVTFAREQDNHVAWTRDHLYGARRRVSG